MGDAILSYSTVTPPSCFKISAFDSPLLIFHKFALFYLLLLYDNFRKCVCVLGTGNAKQTLESISMNLSDIRTVFSKLFSVNDFLDVVNKPINYRRGKKCLLSQDC